MIYPPPLSLSLFTTLRQSNEVKLAKFTLVSLHLSARDYNTFAYINFYFRNRLLTSTLVLRSPLVSVLRKLNETAQRFFAPDARKKRTVSPLAPLPHPPRFSASLPRLPRHRKAGSDLEPDAFSQAVPLSQARLHFPIFRARRRRLKAAAFFRKPSYGLMRILLNAFSRLTAKRVCGPHKKGDDQFTGKCFEISGIGLRLRPYTVWD